MSTKRCELFGRRTLRGGSAFFIALIGVVLVASLTGSGRGHVSAHPALSSDDESWVQTVENIAASGFSFTGSQSSDSVSSDTARQALDKCLRAGLDTGQARYDVLGHCALVALAADKDPNAETDGDDVLVGVLELTVDPRTQAKTAAANALPVANAVLSAQGFSNDEIGQLQGQLLGCLSSYTLLTGLSTPGGVDDTTHVYVSDEAMVECLNEVGALGATDLSALQVTAPTLASLGCPDSVALNTAITCTPVLAFLAPGAVYSWSAPGSSDPADSKPTFTASYSGGGVMTITLSVWNRPGDNTTQATLSASVTVLLGAPVVTSLRCQTPATINVATQCAALVADATTVSPSTTWTWTASNGSAGSQGQQGTGITFTATGDQMVTLTACNPPGGEANCVTVTQPVTVTSTPAPTINSIGCSPQQGAAPLGVYCTASVGGVADGFTETWSAPGGDTATGQGPSFGTNYAKQGTYTITFHTCNGAVCAQDQTFNVTVTGSQAPKLGAITCAPSAPNVGDSVSCSVAFDQSNPPTSIGWQSTGTPASGTGTPFVTKFSSTGTQTVTVVACVGDPSVGTNCATTSLPIVVGQAVGQVGPPMCAPPSPSTGAPVTCTVSVDQLHPPSSITWSAPGGSPSNGTGATFLTGFSNPGPAPVSVTACFGGNASGCTTQNTSVNVVQGSANGPASITGTWNANNGVWSFTQSGGSVTGSIAFSGGAGSATFSGTISNGTVQLNWQCGHDCPVVPSGGTVTLMVASNGCSMQGTYTSNAQGTYVGSGPLSMTKQGCR
jgi:hypothetical protein